jgi:phasin
VPLAYSDADQAGSFESVKRRIRCGEIPWAIWVSNFDQTATENERTQISGAAIPIAETVRREGHALFAAYRPTSFARPKVSQRISPMSEHDQTRKFADKSAAIASETLEKGKAAAEQATRAVQQSYSATVDNIRDFNVKMIDMAQANAEAVFEFARQLATAKQPSDMVELWTAHAKKQFETLTEQTKELSALGQKIAGESAEPITRGVNQAFKKAS